MFFKWVRDYLNKRLTSFQHWMPLLLRSKNFCAFPKIFTRREIAIKFRVNQVTSKIFSIWKFNFPYSQTFLHFTITCKHYVKKVNRYKVTSDTRTTLSAMSHITNKRKWRLSQYQILIKTFLSLSYFFKVLQSLLQYDDIDNQIPS